MQAGPAPEPGLECVQRPGRTARPHDLGSGDRRGGDLTEVPGEEVATQ